MGYVYVLIAACLWGLLGSISKLVFEQGVSPLEAAFWRAVMAWFLFAGHAFALRQVRIQSKDLLPVLAFGVVGISLFYGGYQMAIRTGGAALAAVLLYTAPAIVAVLSWLILKEPMDKIKIGAVILTLAGVALISVQGGSVHITGAAVFWGLLSGLTYATYYIFGKLYLGRYSTPTLFLYALPVGAIGLFPFVNFAQKTQAAWIALIFLSIASTYVAVMVYYAGLKRLEATRASVVATIEPVVAGFVAYIWWGEKFGWLGYVGAGLVLAGVVLMVMKPSSTAA